MSQTYNTIMGLVVGDALGVPVEFTSRSSLQRNPVTDMRGYGTYNQPKGTWSDDSSMTLASLDSLTHGLDYDDLMKRFLAWYQTGAYTPHDELFDIGIATRKALQRYTEGREALKCGGTDSYDNGNGSLMRIAPFVLYLAATHHDLTENDLEGYTIIHNASALTHAHPRSMMACGIYGKLLLDLMANRDQNKEMITQRAIDCALYTYDTYLYDQFASEIKLYEHLVDVCTLSSRDLDTIKSTGYVVHSLEAALYCFLYTDNYRDCVLMAVNLGEDTDTTAAIAGALAGAYYGSEAIPEDWKQAIVRHDEIKALCDQFDHAYDN